MIPKEPPDLKCPKMLNVEVTARWCNENTHASFCGNCKHQAKPAREVSIYQARRDGNNK